MKIFFETNEANLSNNTEKEYARELVSIREHALQEDQELAELVEKIEAMAERESLQDHELSPAELEMIDEIEAMAERESLEDHEMSQAELEMIDEIEAMAERESLQDHELSPAELEMIDEIEAMAERESLEDHELSQAELEMIDEIEAMAERESLEDHELSSAELEIIEKIEAQAELESVKDDILEPNTQGHKFCGNFSFEIEPAEVAQKRLAEISTNIESNNDNTDCLEDDYWDDYDGENLNDFCNCYDDYFSLDNIIRRHPDQYHTIMELREEFDEEILEDILFDLSKND